MKSLLMAVTALVLFTSCAKNEAPPPEPSYPGGVVQKDLVGDPKPMLGYWIGDVSVSNDGTTTKNHLELFLSMSGYEMTFKLKIYDAKNNFRPYQMPSAEVLNNQVTRTNGKGEAIKMGQLGGSGLFVNSDMDENYHLLITLKKGDGNTADFNFETASAPDKTGAIHKEKVSGVMTLVR